MNNKVNRDPAFPVNELNHEDGSICVQHMGLTLRDYFAAQALPSVIAGCASDTGARLEPEKYFAQVSYEIADQMLKAREQ